MVSYRDLTDDELNTSIEYAERRFEVAKQVLKDSEEDLQYLKDEKNRRDYIQFRVDHINALLKDLCDDLCRYDTLDLLNSDTGEVLALGLQNVPFDSEDATVMLSYRGGR